MEKNPEMWDVFYLRQILNNLSSVGGETEENYESVLKFVGGKCYEQFAAESTMTYGRFRGLLVRLLEQNAFETAETPEGLNFRVNPKLRVNLWDEFLKISFEESILN